MQGNRKGNRKNLARMLLPLGVGATCVVALLAGIRVTGAMKPGAPPEGEIIGFQPVSIAAASGGTMVTAERLDQPSCQLDTHTLQHFGGSLVIEAVSGRQGGHILVHWAGQRTAAGRDDCGTQGELMLLPAGVDSLRSAARTYAGIARWEQPSSPDPIK